MIQVFSLLHVSNIFTQVTYLETRIYVYMFWCTQFLNQYLCLEWHQAEFLRGNYHLYGMRWTTNCARLMEWEYSRHHSEKGWKLNYELLNINSFLVLFNHRSNDFGETLDCLVSSKHWDTIIKLFLYDATMHSVKLLIYVGHVFCVLLD